MSTITMEVMMPEIISGDVEFFEIEIARDPAGDFLESESFTVEGDTTSINMEGNENTHVGITIVGVSSQGRRSKPVTKKIQLSKSPAPELGSVIACCCKSDAEPETAADTEAGTDGENTAADTENTSENTDTVD